MDFNLLKDVYYSPEYIKLYLKSDGEFFEFFYTDGEKKFLSRCIKRPIPQLEGYFDLETAYGYGGFYVNTTDEVFIKKALEKYKNYCKNQKIVAQFIRFHPFDGKVKFIAPNLDFFELNRSTVYVDLSGELEYSSTLKRNIKKAQKYFLKVKVMATTEEKFEFLEIFKETYYETMRRNKATKFYFFSEEYFRNILNMKESKLFITFFEDKAVNFLLILESTHNKIAYYHLGATKTEYYPLNVNHLAFDFAIHYYKSKNYKFFYLGGGRTTAKDDSLLRFKRKFSRLEKPFYIGGIVFNREKYLQLKNLLNPKEKLFLFWR